MASALAELIKAATGPVCRTPRRLRDVGVTVSKERQIELESMLHLRDGFRALDHALLVRPSTTVAAVRSVDAWNEFSLWRRPFAHASELYFFAEGVHGVQFGIYKDEIKTFDPQTGALEHFAFKLERWAQRLLEEPSYVGQPAAKAWQQGNQALLAHQRLAPDDPVTTPVDPAGPFRVRDDLDLMRRWTRLLAAKANADDDDDAVDLTEWLADLGTPPPAPPADEADSEGVDPGEGGGATPREGDETNPNRDQHSLVPNPTDE